MSLLSVFACFCVLGLHECSQLDEHISELRRAEWDCAAVCEVSGGKAAFDLKNKICKCTLDKNADEIDRQLVLKEAKLRGVPLLLTKDIAKRQAGSDSTLGQRAPQRIITPRTILRPTTRRPFQFTTNRAFAHRLTTPRINIDVQQRLQQIQRQISERWRSRTRNRNGPRLQQRAGFQDELGPNLMERLREMQKERQEKQRNRTAASTTAASNAAAPVPRINIATAHSSAILGARRNVTVSTNEEANNIDTNSNIKNPNFELITQDPRLYDKDD